MNCIEVGELMQRKLDLDLKANEIIQLEAHLSTCESCNLLFQRLSLLSSQLEQLPRVTPSISIVDSILPQLAEIDKQNEQAATIYINEVNGNLPKTTTPLKFLNKRTIVTVTSGLVAAAAIIFTIGLNNLNQQSQSAADTAESSMTAFNEDNNSNILRNSRTGDAEVNVFDQSGETNNDSFSFGIATESTKTVDQFKISTTNEDTGNVQSPDVNYEMSNDKPANPVFTGTTTDETDETAETELHSTSDHSLLGSYNTVSPDQRFYLEFNEHTITLHDFVSQEPIKSIEVPIEGDINFIGWHEQAIEFYVDIVDNKQQTHTLTFSVGQ